MNRIQEAKRWIASIPKEQLAAKVKEAKVKYKEKVPKSKVYQIANSKASKEQKLIQVARLYLITMYLEEYSQTES